MVSAWLGALNLGMETPYANGGGLRLDVDFCQHGVAFTTHTDLNPPGTSFRFRDSVTAKRLFRVGGSRSTIHGPT